MDRLCEDETSWAEVLQETVESITETLERAKVLYSEDPDAFVNKNYGLLGQAISTYSKLFTRTGCSSRKELEARWAQHFTIPIIRDTIEDLVSVEEEWNEFLVSVDKTSHIITTSSQLEAGSDIRGLTIKLTDVNNEEQIESNLDKFASMNCQIHVISFGSLEGSKKWKEETKCAFPLWTNTDREFYRSLGFKRSIFQVWKIESMIYYGEQKSQKIELPKPITEADGHYHDDPLQMGGNVIINSQGEVIQIYASQFPADRPEVEDMLIVLSRSITN